MARTSERDTDSDQPKGRYSDSDKAQNKGSQAQGNKSDIGQAQGKGFTQWTDPGSGIHTVVRPLV